MHDRRKRKSRHAEVGTLWGEGVNANVNNLVQTAEGAIMLFFWSKKKNETGELLRYGTDFKLNKKNFPAGKQTLVSCILVLR